MWEVMFWWLPDLDDEDDEEEDDDGVVRRVKSKRGATARPSRGLRNRPLPDKKLIKQREGKLKERGAKKDRDDGVKDKKERDKTQVPDKAEGDKDEEKKEAVAMKNKRLEEQKAKKKTQRE